MRKNDTKIFLDKRKLLHMIALRRAGYATTSLAIIFSADRKSIEYHLNKYGLRPDGEVYTLERIIRDVLAINVPREIIQFKIVNGERINLGRDYKDYVEINKLKTSYLSP